RGVELAAPGEVDAEDAVVVGAEPVVGGHLRGGGVGKMSAAVIEQELLVDGAVARVVDPEVERAVAVHVAGDRVVVEAGGSSGQARGPVGEMSGAFVDPELPR